MENSSGGLQRVLLAVLSATSWMAVSSMLIVINKHLMMDYDFKYPMTVSGLGMVTSSILSFLVCKVFKLVEVRFDMTPEYWFRKMLPVGLCSALTLGLGNAVYLHLTMAFIQMLKSFTPVITLICLSVAGLEKPTRPMITAVLLTAAGTAVAAYGELNLSLIGMMIMMGSEFFEAVRLVITQWLLTGLNCHPIEGLMYLAPAGSVFLLLGASILEFPKIFALGKLSVMAAHPWEFLSSAAFGFVVNTLAFITIKLASSLTLKVLGTVKNALLVVFGVMFLGEPVTALTSIGYAISLVGFTLYNKIKMAQIAAGQPTGTKPSGDGSAGSGAGGEGGGAVLKPMHASRSHDLPMITQRSKDYAKRADEEEGMVTETTRLLQSQKSGQMSPKKSAR